MSLAEQDRLNRPTLIFRVIAVTCGLAGLALALPGAVLLSIAGSSFYLLAGLALMVAGLFLWRRPATGGWIYAGIFVATLAWSLWEVGWDGWALLPRLNLFVVLALMLVAAFWWQRSRTSGKVFAIRTASALVAAVVVAVAVIYLVPATSHVAPSADAESAGNADATGGDWPFTGGDAGAKHYSSLDQITRANVSKLKLAWKVHLGMPPAGLMGTLEAAPLMVDDTLYMCNMHNVVSARDIETGKPIWSFDPKIGSGSLEGVCRGVAYYRQPGATGLCAARIISFSIDARMFALDARSGRRCPGFGTNGEVSLLEGMGQPKKGYYFPTASPVIVRGRIVVGGSVLDGQETGEPSGVIRGFDVLTGKFAWAWDMERPDDHGMPAPGTTFTLGTPNSWGPMTGDEDLGLVYAPTGNATPDFVASHRTSAMNKYASSVVALDAETGALRWSFQTVHRDMWDYDVSSPPTLVDYPMVGGPRKALIQPTKRGQFFVLDRATGQSLTPIVERPVPQGAAPGETLSPTQPYPVGFPAFGGRKLTERDMWGLTPYDQLWCRIKFKEARYDGDFTPPGLTPSIVDPGYAGGSEWPGIAIDPVRNLMILNVNHFPLYMRMITRKVADQTRVRAYEAGKSDIAGGVWPQAGTRYAMISAGFVSPLQTPCTKPPYSEIAVVDLAKRSTIWRQPLGTARDSGPWNIPSMLPLRMGVPAIGGPLVTRSGLIFIGATQERSFRAFDLATGALLWETRIPAASHAVPMSYYSKRTRRQFIVIPGSGHFGMNNGQADWLLAYALPKR